jgi:hypothetical protein
VSGNRGIFAGLTSGDSPDVLARQGGDVALAVATGKEVASAQLTAVNQAVAIEPAGRRVGIHLTGTFSGTVQFEVSNNNVDWVSYNVLLDAQTGAGSPPQSRFVTSNSGTGSVFQSSVPYRYFRVRCSAYISGSCGVTIVLSEGNSTPQTQPVYFGENVSSLFSDALGAGTSYLYTGGPILGYNGASFDRIRVAGITRWAAASSSGDTALWTPASGKKFRLMRFMLTVTADATLTGGGVVTMTLRDGTTATNAALRAFVPATAAATIAPSNNLAMPWIDLGNGILSTAANNVLNINLSGALASGQIVVLACGTEE